MNLKDLAKKTWNFIWYEDSFASLIANIILAFVLIKYLVYPALGLAFGTELPIVAVVSNSMYHNNDFNAWWDNARAWYESNGIDYSNFNTFPLKNGFDKGDIMLVTGASVNNVNTGDIVIFDSQRPNPIIHRVVGRYEENGKVYYQTKGDNYITNPRPLQGTSIDETKVPIESLKGKAIFRLPLLGYVKILAMDFIEMFR